MPAAATALAAASTPASVYTVGVSRRPTTSSMASWGGSESTRIGASMPASRSSTPSSTSATPSHVAPPSRAARATGTAPCPYPLALTTAHSWPGRARASRRETLWRTAPRSTSAHTGRTDRTKGLGALLDDGLQDVAARHDAHELAV